MAHNNNSSFQHFIEDASFQQWVLFPDAENTLYWKDHYHSHPEQQKAMDEARNFILSLRFKEDRPDSEVIERSLAQALEIIKTKESAIPIRKIKSKTRIPAFWWAAAALLPILFSVWFIVSNKSFDKELAEGNSGPAQTTTSILPGTDRATLTLADGSVVILDTADQESIMGQQNVKLISANGQITYRATAQALKGVEMQFNKIVTPRGGQYKIELQDGTMVWLNAASSLRYPVAFNSNQREVELEGEGYFEVAHNAAKPFIVKLTDGTQVTVLGTHFNINSYADENAVKTTLLQGSVMIAQGGQQKKLRPGDQAVTGQDKFNVVHLANTDQIVAWKNGYFSFNDDNLESIMRQLSRWYNVEIAFPQGVPDVLFSGELDRNLKLEELLEVFSTMKINYQIENRKLTITP